MPFRIFCTNKGCGKDMEPVIDKETQVVYCTECDKELPTVPIFTKRQMLSMGQVRRAVAKQKAFTTKCSACKKEDTPIIVNNVLACSGCKNELKLSKPFEMMVRNHLKSSN